MTFIVADRVQETTNSPGTGTATLLGAVSGYQSFSTGVGINNTTYYVIADQSGTNWEVGLGALNSTGTVLTRTTVYSSSNGGSTVNFATGTQYVWCDYPSSKAVIQGNPVNFSSIGATTAGTGAFTTATANSFIPNLSTIPTNGVYLPATNSIGIATNSTNAVTIDASQNVGINTTSPTARLDVVGNIQAQSPSYAAIQLKNSGLATNPYYRIAYDSANNLVFNNVNTAYSVSTEQMRIDSSGNVLVTNPAGLGYGTGSGGTVTQATNKSTGVTLNKPTGQITMNNAALAAGAIVTFVVTNSLVAQTDTVVLTASWIGINPSNYRIECMYVGTGGQFGVRVTNISAGSLSEALQINYTIIKGATA